MQIGRDRLYLIYFPQRLVTERDSLREVNEELKCTQLQHVGAAGDGMSVAEQTQAEMLSLPPEIR